MEAIVLDTARRALAVSSASVTRVTGEGGSRNLVLRFAAEVGTLDQLVEGFYRGVIDLPVIVLGTGYQARSSCGYVAVEHYSHPVPAGMPAYPDYPDVPVVGVCGFPWQGGSRALRPLREPQPSRVFAPGAKIVAVLTHGNSNPATAQAAVAGLQLRARALGGTLVAEGQSDYARGWIITPGEATLEGGLDSLPVEHNPEALTTKSLEERCQEHRNLEATIQDSLAADNCREGTEKWAKAHFPGRESVRLEELIPFLGREEVRKVVQAALRRAPS